MINDTDILFEDNHLIIINKKSGQLVQPDKEKNPSLEELVKDYIKQKYNKPGNVYLGVVHRIDRPVSGLVLLAKTSKSLTRLNQMLQEHKIQKKYWAITANNPKINEGTLEHYLVRNESKNISIIKTQATQNSKLAILQYKIIGQSDRYFLWEIELVTGRHHQIRCQLAYIQCPIKGDVKYGFPRANDDRSISLHSRSISFIHPVTNFPVFIEAPVPQDKLWKYFEKNVKSL
jgi:23S rRNA pseudouridine1911/1915/1917 synthase